MNKEYEKTDFAKIYFNAREKTCLVVAQAKRGRAIGEVGEPTVVTDAEFDSRIGDLLLQRLDSYRKQVWSQEIARRSVTPEEGRAFIKKHLSVSIERPLPAIWSYPRCIMRKVAISGGNQTGL